MFLDQVWDDIKTGEVYANKPDSVAWLAEYGGDVFTAAQLISFADRTHALRTTHPAQPKAAVGEPVASVHRDTLAMLNSGQVRAWDNGARLYPASKARFDAAFVGVYTTPQPTHAQAGAMPLDEARRLFDAGLKAAALFCDREDVVADGIIGFGACQQFEAAFSAAHGIKGGQQ